MPARETDVLMGTANSTHSMDEPTGRGRATLVRDGIEFDDRDAALLREIDETRSVATASTNLGRSRARALARIADLEDGFGALVDRRRGGSGGGGSRLTENATDLLNRYSRLQVALAATAQVPETVLEGTVTEVFGELATVETDVGVIRGLHDGVAVDDSVQLRIDADAITVLDRADSPSPDSTSARNRLSGTVTAIDAGETVLTVCIDVAGTTVRALLTKESADRLALDDAPAVDITWKATATRLTRIG